MLTLLHLLDGPHAISQHDLHGLLHLAVNVLRHLLVKHCLGNLVVLVGIVIDFNLTHVTAHGCTDALRGCPEKSAAAGAWRRSLKPEPMCDTISRTSYHLVSVLLTVLLHDCSPACS